MPINPFVSILQSRGFQRGASGVWLSPDTKYGEGCAVEVNGNQAVAKWVGGRTLYEASSKTDLDRFTAEVL